MKTDSKKTSDNHSSAKHSRLVIGIIVGVLSGILFGGWLPHFAVKFSIFGEIFLNALMMIVVPLVILSMIVGITNLGDIRNLRSIGGRTVLYYMITTGIAVLIGIILVNIISPGKGLSSDREELDRRANRSIAEKLQEKEKDDVYSTLKEVLTGNKETGKQGMFPRNIFKAVVNMDILPLIVFSLLFGAAISVLGPRAKATIEVLSTLNDAVMQIVHWIMAIAPVGIFGLVAARIGEAGGFEGFLPELWSLGKYSFTVILGLAIHGFIILPAILKIIGKRTPGKYARGVGAALLNAFSTASSSATLPLTMQGVEEENGISNRTASFVLPLGATVNMDGTALYEAVAAIFIAQVYGISLSPAMQVVVFLTATLAAIGAAGIPEAGLVTMVIVLRAVGLPIEGIGLLLTIDWLLDRFRTTVNVWGDSVGAAVIERLETQSED